MSRFKKGDIIVNIHYGHKVYVTDPRSNIIWSFAGVVVEGSVKKRIGYFMEYGDDQDYKLDGAIQEPKFKKGEVVSSQSGRAIIAVINPKGRAGAYESFEGIVIGGDLYEKGEHSDTWCEDAFNHKTI